MAPDQPADGPAPQSFRSVFEVYEIRQHDDRLVYFGDPTVPREQVLERVWPLFRRQGYEVSLTRRTGETALVAEPIDVSVDGVPWTNVGLFAATLVSTLFAGALWYYADLQSDPLALLKGWPFAVAVMGVLGTHELGHYVMSRYHKVDASLPFFIPMTPPIGTMGAVIKMKGQIPDRKALFDIGVAGPLAGLVATIVVTAVGLMLPPVSVPDWVLTAQDSIAIEFGYPPLLHLIAWVVGEPLTYADPTKSVNPVVIGGWVGMFVTFLNLLPVGQLDGGHILRAILGRRQETVAAAVPLVLFGLAGYLYAFAESSDGIGLWLFWGLLAALFAYLGPANPIREDGIGWQRVAVGVLTLVLGALCFTPVPISIVA